jgi:hypothetical protein
MGVEGENRLSLFGTESEAGGACLAGRLEGKD